MTQGHACKPIVHGSLPKVLSQPEHHHTVSVIVCPVLCLMQDTLGNTYGLKLIRLQAEVDLAESKVKGRYTTKHALDMLQPFVLNFGVSGVDSAPSCVVLQLTNPGEMPKSHL